MQEAVGEIAFDRGVKGTRPNSTLGFPSYGTADSLLKELLYLKVMCPDTSRTNQAKSMNQLGAEMTKAIKSNITKKLVGPVNRFHCWNGGGRGASGDGTAGYPLVCSPFHLMYLFRKS